jgi:hypothetical protein
VAISERVYSKLSDQEKEWLKIFEQTGPASAVDLSEIGEASMPLLCAAVALPAPVLDQRLDWDCTGIGMVSDRLHHILHHVPESRWDVTAAGRKRYAARPIPSPPDDPSLSAKGN